jgi:superfamily II DNA or RNA helicase
VTSVPLPGEAALQAHVSRTAIEVGRRYRNRGQVVSLEVKEGGRRIEAAVQGSEYKPYRQAITISDAGRILSSRCTCPVGGACKHVAAALIAARGRSGAASAPVPIAPPMRPAPPPEPVLSPVLAAWLETVEPAAAEDPEAYPAGMRHRILYLLDVEAERGLLRVAGATGQMRKDGTLGDFRTMSLQRGAASTRYHRPSDRYILARIFPLTLTDSAPAPDNDAATVLRRILATGRARWITATGAALREGPPAEGRIVWRLEEDGAQRAALELPPGVFGFALPDPWYADPATGCLGPVRTGLPDAMAAALLRAPPVPPEAAVRFGAELAKRAPALALPKPAEIAAPEPLQGVPAPHLLLTMTTVSIRVGRFWAGTVPRDLRQVLEQSLDVPVARLFHRYGPVRVPHRPHAPPRTLSHDGKLYRLQRDTRGERAAANRLTEGAMMPMGEGLPGYHTEDSDNAFVAESSDEWIGFLMDEAPELRAAGWQVEIAEDFPIRIVHPDGGIAPRLSETTGIDWLELELGVMLDGQRVDIVPTLAGLIAEGASRLMLQRQDDGSLLVQLPDGRLLALDMAVIRPILAALVELFARTGLDPAERKVRFSRLDAAELAELEARAGLAFQGGESLRALGQRLRAAGGAIPPVALPATFHGELRPYQAEGVAWLQFLAAEGMGGVLADDMGLGKTVQTLAHLAIEHAAGRLDRPALIVCPTSLIPNWLREAARFTPHLRVLALHGPTRKARFGEIAQHDLVLTTYPLLARDKEALSAPEWHSVILDEAQAIRNPEAETTKQARLLKARQRFCLSGTPMQNHLGELWSVFDFIAPGFLGSAQQFRARYRTPIEKHGDTARQAALHRRVKPFLLRRTKAEVVRDLPPKTEILEDVELEAGQRSIYESVRLAMHERVREAIAAQGLARSGIVILDALLKMRQACCDPRLLKLDAAKGAKAGSAKLDRLLDLLATLKEEGRRAIVFSQFTSMLALIQPRLDEAAIPYVLLTGDTRDRDTPVKRFQAGEVPVFLISLKAGGVGLNLTAADTVIHYDPWWNPAVEDQATDRAHRIGQDKPVFVHRLRALGTIEEKMEVLKDRKRALVAAVMDAEHAGALKLTEEDVEALFAAS